MAYRPITGNILLSTGDPARWGVRLVRSSTGWTPADVYPPDTVTLAADSEGRIVPGRDYVGPTVEVDGVERAVVWDSESSDRQSLYTIYVGPEELATVAVPTGSAPLTLQELIELGTPSGTEQFETLLSYVLGLSRGAWSASEAYPRGSLVERTGSVYRATEDVSAPSPDPLLGGPWELWLASAVTLPNGGDTHAVLAKVSPTDQDADWTNTPQVKRLRLDTADPATLDQAGDLAWDDLDQALSYRTDGLTVDIAQENLVYVRNPAGGSTIPKGAVVSVDGASANRLQVQLCSATVGGDGCRTLGVAMTNITSPGFGFVSTFGLLREFNTGTIEGTVTEGADVYVSATPGVLTTVEPEAPARKVLVGYVVTTGANGSIFVTVRRSRRVQELDDVHAPSPSPGQVIRRNQAGTRYEADTLDIDDLGDVQAASPADRQVLVYEATLGAWRAGPVPVGTTGEVRSDFVEPYSYVGTAPRDALETDPVWKITRIDITPPSSTALAFDVAWTDRLTAVYS
jgi:hypothetical protein